MQARREVCFIVREMQSVGDLGGDHPDPVICSVLRAEPDLWPRTVAVEALGNRTGMPGRAVMGTLVAGRPGTGTVPDGHPVQLPRTAVHRDGNRFHLVVNSEP